MDPFSIASFGLSLFEGIASAGGNRDMARAGIESVDKEMNSLRQERKRLEEFHTAKRGMLTDEYGNIVKRAVNEIDTTIGELNQESSRAEGNAGFAYSGTIANRKKLTTQRANESYIHQRQSVFDRFQEDLLNSDVEREDALGSIDTRIGTLKDQRKILEEQSNTKFLGIF